MPTYDEFASAHPPCSSWDVFGRDDELGTINLLTPERVAAAARLVSLTGHAAGRRAGIHQQVR